MEQSVNTKKIIIYCRESRDDALEHYDRIETQRDILVEFCKKRNLGNIVEIIMDDNKTGTNFKRLEPIKEKVTRKEVDMLLCKDASRLGRNIIESLTFAEFLANNNVELVFESERYDEDMFPLIAWFNERRAKDDSIKIRRVIRHKMEEGSLVIKAPYGYIKNGNSLSVDKRVAPVVQEVFDLFINGKTMRQIAYILNFKGYPTPSQLKKQYENLNKTTIWNKQHISRILKHRIYTGDMPYGMREKASYKSKKYTNKPEEQWIVIPNHHEAIITKEAFETVQSQLRRNKRNKIREFSDKTFSGMLFCARCGSRMIKIERKTLKSSYVCGKSHKEGCVKDNIRENYGCSPHRVFLDDLACIVKRYIEKMLTDPGFQKVLQKEINNCTSACDEIVKQIKLCESKISNMQKKATIIYDDKLNGAIPDYLFEQQLGAVNKELLLHEEKLKKLNQFADSINGKTGKKYDIETVIKEIHKSGVDYNDISMLFKKILVFNPNEITEGHRLEYGLPDEEYRRIKADGGILFVQNYVYRLKMLNYE